MKKISITFLFAFLIFTISCDSLGGGSEVSIKAGDFEKTFVPKTAIAYIDRTLNRPGLNVFLANFDFNPKNRGDLFRPNVRENPDNIVIRVEIKAAENAEPKDNFKLGETALAKGDDSQQRFYSMNIYRVVNNSTESVKLKNYKEAKVNIESLTEEKVTGSFDVQFSALGQNGAADDENGYAKGSFEAKFWKEQQ